jgi:FlaA1/EpsC-like NDP-sugar epimerase
MKNAIRQARHTVFLLVIDIVLINLAMIVALQLIHDMNVPVSQYRRFANLWPIMTAFCLFGFWVTRMYKTLWAYAGVDNVAQIAIGTAVGVGLTYAFCSVMMLVQPNPNRFMLLRSTYIIFAVILLLLMFTARFSFRIIERLGKGGMKSTDANKKRVMIVGAGWAAASVARDLTTAGGLYGAAMPPPSPRPLSSRAYCSRQAASSRPCPAALLS